MYADFFFQLNLQPPYSFHLQGDKKLLNFFHLCFFRWKIRIGVSKLDDDNSAFPLNVKKQTIHPNYDGQTHHFDLSILETEVIEFNRAISPVCLPVHKLKNRNEYDEKTVQLIGWGSKFLHGSLSNLLKRVSITIFPNR